MGVGTVTWEAPCCGAWNEATYECIPDQTSETGYAHVFYDGVRTRSMPYAPESRNFITREHDVACRIRHDGLLKRIRELIQADTAALEERP